MEHLNLGDNCHQDIKKCSSVIILEKILNQYNEWINKDSPDPCTINEIFDSQRILNHFHHLLVHHSTDNEFEYIYHIFSADKCNINQCTMFKRNYKDRDNHKDYDKEIHAITTQQILDKIHCHFLHSYDIGFRLTSKESYTLQNITNDDQKDDDNTDDYKSPENEHQLLKIENNNDEHTAISTQNQVLFRMKLMLSKKHKVYRLQRKYNKFCSDLGQQQESFDEKTQQQAYHYGVKYYYWRYYTNNLQDDEYNFDYKNDRPYKLKDWVIDGKYNSLKEELITNEICTVAYSQFNSIYTNAEQNLMCEYGKVIKCEYDAFESKYEINKHDSIRLEHLLAMMVYCNKDQIQHRFTETYQRMPDESDDSLKKRHSNYYWLGKLLRELVECFGSKIYGNPVSKFWHCISHQTLFHGIKSRIYGPISTTSEQVVAMNFSQQTGLILEFKDGETHDSAKYFGCQWLSDFPNEAEIFFIGGIEPLLFSSIVDTNINQDYSLYLKGLNIINQIFNGNLYENYDSNDKYFGVVVQNLVSKLINHYLSRFDDSGTYAIFKTIPEYIDKLLVHSFENMRCIYIDWNLNCIRYEFARNYIFKEEYQWININLLCQMFPNLISIQFKNGYKDKINLCKSTMEDIYEFLSKNSSTINTIHIQCNNDTSALKPNNAIKQYHQQYKSINFSLSLKYTDWLVITRRGSQNEIKMRKRRSHLSQHEINKQQETKPIIIKPSKKLTKTTIPKYIKEKYMKEQVKDAYDYMNKYLIMHGNEVMKELDIGDNTIKIINYNFHCQETNSILYAICEKRYKSNNIDFEWKMKHELFTENQIENEYQISKHQLPNTLKKQPTLMMQLEKKNVIENLLKNANKRNHMIKNAKWNNSKKIPIFNIKHASKVKFSAQLTKEEFIKRLQDYSNNEDISIVPIITFEEDIFCLQFVWIIQIKTNIANLNIGILLKVGNQDKNIEASGIYLDIYDQHKLVPYQHDCKCADNFESHIDELQIGNEWQNKMQQLEQFNKSLKQKTDEYQNIIHKLQKEMQSIKATLYPKVNVSWRDSNVDTTYFKDADDETPYQHFGGDPLELPSDWEPI